MSSGERVAIIIVVWNNYPDTQDCLRSLETIRYPEYKIVVVDNGSTDNSGELVKNNFRDVIVLRNNENLGYTGGCNTGLSFAFNNLAANYCLILNNDTVSPCENFLEVLVNAASQHKNNGIVAPVVCDYTDPKIVQSAGVQVNLFLGRARPNTNKSADLSCWDAVHGCAFLVKKEVFEVIGGLDDQFYLYWEEIDYCLRVKESGYQIVVSPDTYLLHKSGKSIGGKGSLYTYYFYRNRLLLMRKHAKLINWFTLIPLLPIYAMIHVVKSGSEGNSYWGAALAIRDGWIDFYRGKFGRRNK